MILVEQSRAVLAVCSPQDLHATGVEPNVGRKVVDLSEGQTVSEKRFVGTAERVVVEGTWVAYVAIGGSFR